MLRENNSAGAKYIFLALTAQGGSTLQSRATADASAVSADGPQAKLPIWLKLARRGDLFTGYLSADGKSWQSLGGVTVPMNKILSAGLVLTSHNNSTLNSMLFDYVAVKP